MSETTPAEAHRRLRLLLLLAVVALVAGACASGDDTLDAVDPQAVDANPTYEEVFAILHNRCVLCHDGGGEGEEDLAYGGPALAAEDDLPGFEDCTSIVASRNDILERVEDNTMPPGALPRLTSEEKLTIRRWVENGAPAPCN